MSENLGTVNEIAKKLNNKKWIDDKFENAGGRQLFLTKGRDFVPAPLPSLHIVAGSKPENLLYMIEKYNIDLDQQDEFGRTPFWYLINYGYCNDENSEGSFKNIFYVHWNPDINAMDKFGANLFQSMISVGFNPLTDPLIKAKWPKLVTEPAVEITWASKDKKGDPLRELPLVKLKEEYKFEWAILINLSKRTIAIPLVETSNFSREALEIAEKNGYSIGMRERYQLGIKDLTSFDIKYGTSSNELELTTEYGEQLKGELYVAQLQKNVVLEGIIKGMATRFQPVENGNSFKSSCVNTGIHSGKRGVILTSNTEGNELILLDSVRGEDPHTKFICLQKGEYSMDDSLVEIGQKERCSAGFENLLKFPRLLQMTD